MRKLAAVLPVTAAAVLASVAGCSSQAAACHVAGRTMPAGTVIKVDARGNAWTDSTRVSGPAVLLACSGGSWVRQ
jgi:hypothetical protein